MVHMKKFINLIDHLPRFLLIPKLVVLTLRAFPKWNLMSFVIYDAIELPMDEFYHLKDNDERMLRMVILIKKN